MINSFSGIEYQRLQDEFYQELNHACEDDTKFCIYGYKQNKLKCFLFNVVSVLLLGIPHILLTWYKQMNVIKYTKCSLRNAELIYIKQKSFDPLIITIENECIEINGVQQNIRYFTYQHSKYIWKNDLYQFVALKVPDENITLNDLLDNSNGLTKKEHYRLLNIHGPNKIIIEEKSYLQLFIEEVFNPFYVFQIFSIVLWSCDEYYIYAGCIFVLSVGSIVTALYETKKQSRKLLDLVESSNCHQMDVLRRKEDVENDEDKFTIEIIDPIDLVPDDLIVIPPTGCTMPCDAVLLSGTCIVNESMLTGESIPVTKTPPHHGTDKYNVELHKRHTLFAGTHVIQTRFYGGEKVFARVIRTGFYTSKGELIKSILYPKPTKFQFYKDSIKFVLFLSLIATLGMAYCIWLYAERHATIKTIIIRALDIITIVVPPALPAAMTVGTIYSQNRLKDRNIFCISPPRINVCGKLKLVCFDKTGTLTHDGLDFYGVIPNKCKEFNCLIQEVSVEMDEKDLLLQAMATCHSLTMIDGKLTGDPLDLSMFESTKWVLDEPGEECTRFDMLAPTVVRPEVHQMTEFLELDLILPFGIGIIRQFPFTSSQQCMSVICRELGAANMKVFTKGAPEKIRNICKSETIPDNFLDILTSYTTSGYRVIAVATKELNKKMKWKDSQKIKRDAIETNLEFLGLIIMQNALKKETTPIIKELQGAKIRTLMVTGDNVMTAISVSRKCGMVLPNENIALLELDSLNIDNSDDYEAPKLKFRIIGNNSYEVSEGEFIINLDNLEFDHIALDGLTWSALRTHYPELIPNIVISGTIFARFRPEQKTQLVTSLQELDYIVAMCGDGANDCGALKAAHIGVSLSQAEASVAAPFTSAIENISCMKYLILEGRCALVTSFSVFKYMAMYSLIQFFTVLILYKRYSILGNMQFLYIDLVITTSLAIAMGRQGPADILTSKRPPGSLVSIHNLIPLILQIILCGIIQYGSLYFLTLQRWFSPLLITDIVDEDEEDGKILCWENTVVFCVSCFQYLILAFVYSKGKPYRQSIITNGWMLFTSLFLTIFTVILLVYPYPPLDDIFEMMPISKTYHQFMFRFKILLFPIAHFFTSLIIETCMAERKWLKCLAHFVSGKKQPKNKYKLIPPMDDEKLSNICSSVRSDIY